MLLLAIDTSTSAIGVALLGEQVSASAAVVDARGHTEHLAPLVQQCLDAASCTPDDVTDVVVGNGPGPFTGLRVGIVTGLVFGHARGIPVHGLCSLDALAHDAAQQLREGEVVVATDARRKEVYWARYALEGGAARRVTDPAVSRPADLPAEVRALPTAGRGPLLYPDLFAQPLALHDVRAESLAVVARDRLARGETLAVEPLYLRRPDALTSAERARS